jgi:isoleucyl-tRNA synthetase
MNYKDTLNLPQTNFPMKANLSGLEPRMISYWAQIDIYAKMLASRADSDKFVLHDGPPYANGLIHIGHALNKTLKDIIVKYKTIQGYKCPYVVGWDCHGLPVEHQLFKELKLTKHDVEISDFRKKAKDYALKFVDLQREDFKRLALFSDWDNPYLTLDPLYEYNVIKMLQELTAGGYVYRGRKPVNWCCRCETALAEAEVEYADKKSESIYFIFKVAGDSDIFSEHAAEDISFLVWTTTPWTLVSNVAVAINPNLEYVLASCAGKTMVLAKERLNALSDKFETQFNILKTFKGTELASISLAHPFLPRQVKTVLADFVSSEDGSGCVHIAPGHGADDFSLTKTYNLDIIMTVNEKGVFFEPKTFAGKNITQANVQVIELLKNNNYLIKHETINHSYPHCWRCSEPIIFRATYQWFVAVDHNDLRSNTLASIENVKWVPYSGKARMKAMISSRPDWCISRQRLWGIPIPAVKCKKCGEVLLKEEVIAKVAEVFKEKGSDSWFANDISDFIPADFKCSNCAGEKFEKEFDILDVWFESGASFRSVVKANSQLRFPADLYLEGSDQHRGWFQVSLLPSVALEKKPPFKATLTHGFVVDGSGKKMSKSLGNVIAPQKIISRYGAEILRLWAAYADYSEDIKISEDILKQLVDMYRKVRNTIRFILGNTHDFDLKNSKISYDSLVEVDKFMLSKTAQFSKEVAQCYDEYSLYKVCQKIFSFCNLDLSSFYLDILKDRLYTFSQKSKERQSAQLVLCTILQRLLTMIAPILSFTAEEAYQAFENLKEKKESIFLETFEPSDSPLKIDTQLLSVWEKLFDIRQKIFKEIELKREQAIIGSSLEAAVVVTCQEDEYNLCKDRIETLKEILIVSSLEIRAGAFSIEVSKAKGQKCPRCWHWSESNNGASEDICTKCVKSLKEAKT